MKKEKTKNIVKKRLKSIGVKKDKCLYCGVKLTQENKIGWHCFDCERLNSMV